MRPISLKEGLITQNSISLKRIVMNLPEIQKVILNSITIVAWALGIFISFFMVARGIKRKGEIGVSFKTYFILVVITEIFYAIGAAMILTAMGINTIQHLANLELWKFYQIISKIDLTTIKIVGIVGWVGFAINRSVSFLSPGYLIVYGRKKLPKFFYYSALTEVSLETFMTVLIFVSLIAG